MTKDWIAERAANYSALIAERDRIAAAAPVDQAALERANANLRGARSRMEAMGDPITTAASSPPVEAAPAASPVAVAPISKVAALPARKAVPAHLTPAEEAETVAMRIVNSDAAHVRLDAEADEINAVARRIAESDAGPEDEKGVDVVARRILAA
jgi:hypothetical protein